MTAGLNNLLNRNVTANVGFIKSHLYNQKRSPSFFCNIVTLHISDHIGIDRSSRDTKLDVFHKPIKCTEPRRHWSQEYCL